MPDLKVLGTKLKKEAVKVKNALPKVSQEEIKAFVKDGKITVAGHELGEGDLSVTRIFENEGSSYHAHFTKDVLVLMDTALDQGLIAEGLAREVINRVQRLRKKVSCGFWGHA